MIDEYELIIIGGGAAGFAAPMKIAAQSFTRDITKMSCARE